MAPHGRPAESGGGGSSNINSSDNRQGAFARNQLERYGWESGKGLGKELHGRADAIKVRVKNDKDGLGKEHDRFDFAWWDHVYNKAASNIVIESDSDAEEVVCRTNRKLTRSDIVRTRPPDKDERRAPQAAPKKPAAPVPSNPLYAMFVRSTNHAEDRNGDKQDEDDHADDLRDYSMNWSDEALLQVCEGRRFGHRGGYKQGGKALRLSAHDHVQKLGDPNGEESSSVDRDHAATAKERKKKKKRATQHPAVDIAIADEATAEICEEHVVVIAVDSTHPLDEVDATAETFVEDALAAKQARKERRRARKEARAAVEQSAPMDDEPATGPAEEESVPTVHEGATHRRKKKRQRMQDSAVSER